MIWDKSFVVLAWYRNCFDNTFHCHTKNRYEMYVQLQWTTKSCHGNRKRAFVTSWCQGQSSSSISSLAFWRESFYTLLFCHFLSPSPIDFYGRNFLLSLLRPLHIVFFIKKPIFHKNKSPFHSVKEASVFSSVYDSENALSVTSNRWAKIGV